MESLCLAFSDGDVFVAQAGNLAWGGVFKLPKECGYPVFRFVKDVVVNNGTRRQARMAELSAMKMQDVLAVKPEYHAAWW